MHALVSSANTVPAPDARVQSIEDEFQALPDLQNLSLGSKPLPKRPGYGKDGQPFVAWVNYVEL